MESVPLFDLTETMPAYGARYCAFSHITESTGSSDLAAVILEGAEPYRLTDDEGGFRPSLPAKICVEPWALRPLKRKAHDNDGVAILLCSDSRARVNPGPRSVGGIFTPRHFDSIVLAFFDKHTRCARECFAATPTNISIPTHNGGSFDLQVAAVSMEAFKAECQRDHIHLRDTFDPRPYKQVWKLIAPVNYRPQLIGEVYFAKDLITQLGRPQATFCFTKSLGDSIGIDQEHREVEQRTSSPSPETGTATKSYRRRAPRTNVPAKELRWKSETFPPKSPPAPPVRADSLLGSPVKIIGKPQQPG